MSVAHTSRIRIQKHEGPHRTAHIEDFAEPIHLGAEKCQGYQTVKGCIECSRSADMEAL